MLAYYVVLNVALFWADDDWLTKEVMGVVDHQDPETYEIPLQLYNMATKIRSDDATINASIDSYVQGVYARRIAEPNSETGLPDETFIYVEAIDCLQEYPDLSEEIANTLRGYMCPKAGYFELRGNLG